MARDSFNKRLLEAIVKGVDKKSVPANVITETKNQWKINLPEKLSMQQMEQVHLLRKEKIRIRWLKPTKLMLTIAGRRNKLWLVNMI